MARARPDPVAGRRWPGRSVDLYEQEIPAGSRSAKHWHISDEVLYVLSGSQYSLHWEVEAEIAERYYARIAGEPTRHVLTGGDILYVRRTSCTGTST